MIDYKQAGQRIREQRKRLGLTQETISERIHITPSFYSQIETGTRKAGINTFFSISQELSISLDYILGNNIQVVTTDEFDDVEYKIFHHLNSLSPKEKIFILNTVIALKNL